MIVAASSECYSDLPYDAMLERLTDLQFTAFELALHANSGPLSPSEILANPDTALDMLRQTRRLTISCLSFGLEGDDETTYRQFTACCKLAKANKVVAMVVPAGELGTPFNGEVERLRELVAIAAFEGVRVGVKTEVGRVTQDPDTTKVLCDNVKGLGVTLDPSHFIFGPHQGASFDQIMQYVCHVQLRDTTKDKLQVRVGQGEVDYGRLITQLKKHKYDRALTVDIHPAEGVDQDAECRKLRLLLESLLI